MKCISLGLLSTVALFAAEPVAVAAQTQQAKHAVSTAEQQEHRYKGFLDVRVIEPEGAQYILGVKFHSGYSKPVHYTLRHYNGKAAIQTFKPFYEQNNGDDIRTINMTHQYYFSMRIREDNDKTFSARVKLFKRRDDLKIDINQPYRFSKSDFRLIEDQPVKGEFNTDNEYLFVDSGELKFYIKLNFDLIFTKAEIMERFSKGQNQD